MTKDIPKPHKFKTNLDGLKELGNIPDLPYTTIIFCEKCGLVVYEANKSKSSIEVLQLKVGYGCVS